MDGNALTVELVGSGFSVDSNGEVQYVGTISNIVFYAGSGAFATQQIASLDFDSTVAALLAAIDADSQQTNDSAIEDFFLQMDWIYNGTGQTDTFPATAVSDDNIPLNFVGDDFITLAGGNDLFF